MRCCRRQREVMRYKSVLRLLLHVTWHPIEQETVMSLHSPLIDLIVSSRRTRVGQRGTTVQLPRRVVCCAPHRPALALFLARSRRKEATKHNRNRLSGSLTAPQCSERWLSESGTLELLGVPPKHAPRQVRDRVRDIREFCGKDNYKI